MQAWQASDSIELVCEKKWSETPDTVSFSLVAPKGELTFNFKPGQFCSLGFEIEGKSEYRAYSVSSLPGESRLCFTVKRVNGGLVSTHIVDHLQAGHSVTALIPVGQFNSIDCQPSAKVTMVSAGCGISPVMCMVKEWLAEGVKLDIDFIHMARSRENTIYFAELEKLAAEHENFHLKLLLKNSEGTAYPQGRLDQEWLIRLSPDITERTVYLCGPVGFMEDIGRYLQELEFDMSRFFEESFTPIVNSATAAESVQTSTGVTIAVPDFGKELEAEVDSLLMEVLETGQLPVIAACRSGVCGSCKVQVKEGEVESSSTETLTADDIENGYVLACSCKVKSNLEVGLG